MAAEYSRTSPELEQSVQKKMSSPAVENRGNLWHFQKLDFAGKPGIEQLVGFAANGAVTL